MGRAGIRRRKPAHHLPKVPDQLEGAEAARAFGNFRWGGFTPAGSFDYVIANDVFIYVGAIDDIVPAALNALRRGGRLIFSCETAADEEGDFVLRPSKRYAHSRAYIEQLCRDAGCARVAFENIDLRQENQVAIPGFIAVAEHV